MKYIIGIICISLSVFASADELAGKVTGFIPYSAGEREILIFRLDTSVVGGCNTTARFAIDDTSPKYKATLSAVLAAYHAQSPVLVQYLQSCTAWANAADVNYICVGNISC